MNTITKYDLLKYFWQDAKSICDRQEIEIDEDYNLVDNEKNIVKPEIEIDDTNAHLVVIKIKYKIVTEHTNITEIKMSKPKHIFRGKELYQFDKVVK